MQKMVVNTVLTIEQYDSLGDSKDPIKFRHRVFNLFEIKTDLKVRLFLMKTLRKCIKSYLYRFKYVYLWLNLELLYIYNNNEIKIPDKALRYLSSFIAPKITIKKELSE